MLLGNTSALVAGSQKFTVVIDAGHGGGDPGTLHRKGKQDEKTIALNVALKLGRMIESNHSDVKVVYTRKTDMYPSLPERTRIARTAKGNLFISLHVNAAADASARGFETYVFGISGAKGKSASEQTRLKERMEMERENLDINGRAVDFDSDVDIETKILCQAQREKHNKQSQEVAEYVQNAIINDLRGSSYRNNVTNRGVKQKNIFVLCYSPMPAILVEMGYMTNRQEEAFINTNDAQELFARSLYKGFKRYKTNWDKRQLDSSDEESEEVQAKEPVAAPQAEDKKPKAEDKKPKAEEKKPKAEDKKPKAEEKKPKAEDKQQKSEAVYRIQVLVLKRTPKSESVFKGVEGIRFCYKDETGYHYTIGEASTKAELRTQLTQIKKKFPDAFIIKTDKNGNRIK